jgi:hypothetical protein
MSIQSGSVIKRSYLRYDRECINDNGASDLQESRSHCNSQIFFNFHFFGSSGVPNGHGLYFFEWNKHISHYALFCKMISLATI